MSGRSFTLHCRFCMSFLQLMVFQLAPISLLSPSLILHLLRSSFFDCISYLYPLSLLLWCRKRPLFARKSRVFCLTGLPAEPHGSLSFSLLVAAAELWNAVKTHCPAAVGRLLSGLSPSEGSSYPRGINSCFTRTLQL